MPAPLCGGSAAVCRGGALPTTVALGQLCRCRRSTAASLSASARPPGRPAARPPCRPAALPQGVNGRINFTTPLDPTVSPQLLQQVRPPLPAAASAFDCSAAKSSGLGLRCPYPMPGGTVLRASTGAPYCAQAPAAPRPRADTCCLAPPPPPLQANLPPVIVAAGSEGNVLPLSVAVPAPAPTNSSPAP